jgi:type IV pilus biogenesis protein CpaD/CtpE
VALTIVQANDLDYAVLVVSADTPAEGSARDPVRGITANGVAAECAWVVLRVPGGTLHDDAFSRICQSLDQYFGRWML